MKEQNIIPSLSEDPNRDTSGRFKSGNNANPSGENGRQKGWQPYGLRIQRWLDLPVDELNRIVHSKEELKKLSTIDAICVRHVANTLRGMDVRGERKDLLDRIEGQPKELKEVTGKDGAPLNDTSGIVNAIIEQIAATKANSGPKPPKVD